MGIRFIELDHPWSEIELEICCDLWEKKKLLGDCYVSGNQTVTGCQPKSKFTC